MVVNKKSEDSFLVSQRKFVTLVLSLGRPTVLKPKKG